MWIYEKKLQYPVRVGCTNLKLAQYLFTQYGGPDGELSAALRYLNQRYTIPTNEAKALLTDIGTEELAHVEVITTMIYQLTKDATAEDFKRAGMGDFYAIRDGALFYSDSNGVPWTAAYIQATSDPITDLHEDMAAEQKARTVYENLIKLSDDTGVIDTLKFLREREVVHYQRFGEALRIVQEYQQQKKIF